MNRKRKAILAVAILAACAVLAAGCTATVATRGKSSGRSGVRESATASSSGDGTDAKEAGDTGKAGSKDNGTSKPKDDDTNTGTKGGDKKAGTETKDDGTKTGGGTAGGGTTGSGTGGGEPEKHTHKYVKTTEKVHVDEQGHWENVCVKEAWTEDVPVYKEQEVAVEVCNTCGKELSHDEIGPHINAHLLKREGGSHRTEYRMKQVQTGTTEVQHPAEYQKQWVVDVPAHDETVTVYKCSCGAKKENK